MTVTSGRLLGNIRDVGRSQRRPRLMSRSARDELVGRAPVRAEFVGG